RRPGGALDEVVEGGDDGGLAAAVIDRGADAQGVRAGDLAGRGGAALGQHGDEVLVRVVRLQGVQQTGGGGALGHGGGAHGEDAAAHRHQHGSEAELLAVLPGGAAQVLQHLGDVAVSAADG